MKLSAGEAERFKSGWRASNGRITQFWAEMEMAAKIGAAAAGGMVFAVGGSGVAFTCTPRTLADAAAVGAGAVLSQAPARPADTGLDLSTGGPRSAATGSLQRTWGGKLAENATQAAARDIMAEAMLRAFRRARLVPCMTVHDELVYAVSIFEGQHDAMSDLMLEPPPWAGGLPLAGESKIMRRYGVNMPLGQLPNHRERRTMTPS